ncbi:MAG: peptidoglycan DD-metalloendopeptidase family protein [Spirochaetes bacterium]|nr:peptidoglycan DD-metalloendopeptidase family protein [Spirochaetota bacterium]
MKQKPRRIYKIGKFSMTILPNEVMVFFAGKERLYTRLVGRLFFRGPRRALMVLASIAALSLIIFLPGDTLTTKDPVDPALQDEIEKNDILQSRDTDYSSPDEKEKLQIAEHLVRPGENLSVIAEKYGVSVDTICGSNNLRSYDFIKAGVRLRIPSKDGILYRVRPGNNITGIAKKYRVSLAKIIAENGLANPDFAPVGSELFVPDAKPQNIIRGFLWPVASKYITCGYGWRRNPFNRKYRQFHQGIDIRARYQRIRASKFGKVTYTGWLGGYGKTVVIAHPGGWKTLYGHLSGIYVRRGQYVKQGQSIGRSGNTGRSTGPHLHFEILKSGRHKNPYVYLRKK